MARDLPPLNALRAFEAVARLDSVSRAAAELHIAQPSMSRQISHFEGQVGARLLDRTRQGTRLTEAGADGTAAPLGTAPEVIDLLVERFAQSR